MPRPPKRNSGGTIFFRARNDGEGLLFAKFKEIMARDGFTYHDKFLPVIEAVVVSDNPQLKFVQQGDALVLNKTVPPTERIFGPRKMTCEHCRGEGCENCAGQGVVYLE